MEHTPESAFYALNAQCLSPKATSTTRWKIPYISEHILNSKDRFVPFMGITETWLKGYITDAQVHIENYSVFRSNREMRKNGGALLYVHNSYIVSSSESFRDQFYNCIILKIEELNCITAAVYRPPDCPTSSFNKALLSIQTFIDCNSESDTELYITGDFNLPNVDWNTLSVDTSLGKKGTDSANNLLQFMADNFLTQVVDNPTRGKQ